MEPTLLGTDLLDITDIDIFESLIWKDRYCGYGDFELCLDASIEMISYLQEDRYLILKESEHAMIIEAIEIESDIENGDKIIATGRSLESILDRRVIRSETVLDGNFQDGIKQLITDNAINDLDIPNRNMSRLVFEDSVDPTITSLTIKIQFDGENLYNAIVGLCLSKNIGFKIKLDQVNGLFVFSLYRGTDRSYDQSSNPYVVFSSEFDNIITGDYKEDKTFLKTVALVAGELGVGNKRRKLMVELSGGGGSDLARREMFTDAQSITRNVEGGPLTDQQYDDQLTQKGLEDLSNNIFTQMFEGQVDSSNVYIYGVDFFMGDILQIEDEYGHSTKTQVVELINSKDLSGTKTYPSFSTVL